MAEDGVGNLDCGVLLALLLDLNLFVPLCIQATLTWDHEEMMSPRELHVELALGPELRQVQLLPVCGCLLEN